MMALSAGDAVVEELLISDTSEVDLAPSDIISTTYKEDLFAAGDIKADVLSSFGDDNYHMRVKTLPEVSGLELRGTPAESSMAISFAGSVMTFWPYSNGDYPDLSSLISGSPIIISNAIEAANNGTFTVDSVDIVNHTVTVLAHTFTTEPTYFSSSSISSTSNSITFTYTSYIPFRVGDSVKITSNTIGGLEEIESYIVSAVYYDSLAGTVTVYTHKPIIYGAVLLSSHTIETQGSGVDATFKTSYGAYTLDNTPSTLDSVEVDIEYPRGIYDSDTSGNFTDRTILLEYKLIGNIETSWLNIADPTNVLTYTEIEKTNTPQRRTYSLPIPAGIDDSVPLKLRLRRSSAEVADIKSQDQSIVTRVKAIYDEPGITDYGNVTLLWVRAKATNAISSQGQFQINAWVSRSDVDSDITSVITDLYTNTDYGAGLSSSDLVLPEMVEPLTEIDTPTDTGYVAVTSSTYYGSTGSIFCPQGSTEIAVFWDNTIVLSAVCADNTDASSYGYHPGEVYYSSVDGWYYMVESDMDNFYTSSKVRRFKYLSTDYYAEFNGAIDSKINLMDAIKMIGKAGRFNVYLDGQSVKMKKDEPQLIRTALFNETNILKDSFKIDYLFGEYDNYDGMAVKYRSPTDFKEAIATYPSTSSNPQVTELIGCTDFDLALAEATYGWRQKESRRKIVSFSTDIQGIIPNYLDRIAVTHNVPDWGLSSHVEAVNGNIITIGCQLFGADGTGAGYDENTDYDMIIFRKDDGTVSDLYSFTIVDRYNIELFDTPPTWIYTGYDYDKTFFSIGASNIFVKDYIVTEISPRGDNVVDIKAINYDATVYDKPVLVDASDNTLIDAALNELT
jgi:hypothetical protein